MTLRFGTGKSSEKWASQLRKRGWTEAEIVEAIRDGQAVPAANQLHPSHGAVRYIHPTTGKSVVLDEVTREVLHVGASGFRY